MEKSENQVVVIDNIGPIEHLEIPLIPGVVVLRGHIGAGKTTAISAIGTLATGKGKLSKRDGVLTAGKIKGCGVTLTVNQRSTRAGTLEVECIEDRLSLTDLVDPKVADPLAADAKRIKALVSLSGIEADLSLFADSIKGNEKAIGVEAKTQIDPLVMARLVKRDLESVARQLEQDAEELAAKITAATESVANVDLSGEHDIKKLSDAHTAAVQTEARMKAEQAAAVKAKQAAEKLAEALSAAKKSYAGPTVEAAKKAHQKSTEAFNTAVKIHNDIIIAELEARKDVKSAQDRMNADVNALNAATAHAHYVVEAEAAMTTPPAGPTDEEVQEAIAAVAEASEAIRHGVSIRSAIDAQARIKAWESALETAKAKTKSLRSAAQGVEPQLAKCLSFDGFEIIEGRLAVTTNRGQTHLADLSTGERARWALNIAATAAGVNNLIPIPQEMWQSLNPAEQASIAKMLAEKGVTGVAAAVADGELRAELFGDHG